MANPYFSFKQFTIRQDRCAMKITTDACILGAYADYPNPGKILDIGSGSGVLSLMSAQKFTGSIIHGVEIEREAYEQSVENAKDSPWNDRITFFNEKIQDFSAGGKQYDLILCNPPYYQDQLKTENKKKNIARHSDILRIEELVYSVNELLNNEGVFYVIMPVSFFPKIKDQLGIFGIYLFDTLQISHRKRNPFYAITGGFSRSSQEIRKKSIFITDESNNYSQDFKKLLKEFYLEF